MKRLLWIGLVIVGFVLVGQPGQAQQQDNNRSHWVKICQYDKLRNIQIPAMNIISFKKKSYGDFNGSVSFIQITDIYNKDAGSNCTKPNYNTIFIKLFGLLNTIDILPCENNLDTCSIHIKFDNGPIQSFTPVYTDNSVYTFISPELIHQLKTHRSVIMEIPTVKGTAQYEFDLRGFDHPVLVNDYK